jgi:hypothetical protein
MAIARGAEMTTRAFAPPLPHLPASAAAGDRLGDRHALLDGRGNATVIDADHLAQLFGIEPRRERR